MDRLKKQILELLDEDKKILQKIYYKFLDDHAFLWEEFEDLYKLRRILLVIIKLFYQEHRQLHDVRTVDYEEFRKEVRELIANPDALLQKARNSQVKEFEYLGLERWFEHFRRDIKRINQIIEKYEPAAKQIREVRLGQFEEAKKVLGSILNREWTLRGSAPEEYMQQLRQKHPEDTDEEINYMATRENPYFLRKTAPEILTKGTHQIILRLGNGYIGKTRIEGGLSNHYVLYTSVYEPHLDDTLRILDELGFEVPEHHYVGIENQDGKIIVRDRGFGFVIAQDLTEGGKYRVEDVKDEHFEALNNGTELKQQLADASRTLQGIYDKNNPFYALVVSDHVTDEGPQEAFRHMFFVQIDPTTNTGKLVLGDLDHVILYIIS